ncbi:hypothetical protein OSC27_03935 [Microbacterium sp. STN6]|uniref:hypothetical protein n=1 Tax=Microbacterium sp. STN6 TaxID=2995588 RepID=UPI002260BD97|nr:hypothetical protein [Microbacterium sp. STN6]MCX7521426.1 hypothetical protein [Microbacterium sp. STN6]
MKITLLPMLLAAGLTGCAATPSYESSLAASLEHGVLVVTTDAAAGDFSKALAALDDLQGRLASEQASGRIPSERSARISASIERVRGDLNSAIAAARQTTLDEKLTALNQQQQQLTEAQQQLAQQLQREKNAANDTHDDTKADAPGKPGGNNGTPPGQNSGHGKGKPGDH